MILQHRQQQESGAQVILGGGEDYLCSTRFCCGLRGGIQMSNDNLSLYSDTISGHIARRSDLELTDSAFCLCIVSSTLSMDGQSSS